MNDPNDERRRMVERQIAARGVRDPLVLEAMRRVPREEFIPEELREFAYQDSPLPILEGQTISQPYIVAFMTEALELEGGEKVLEIGTGSGYAAAVLGEIAAEVWTIERHESLAATARERLRELGYENVHVICADGTRGWPEAAPYDAVIVAAGGPEVPRSLRQQLFPGGRLVIPIGTTPRAQSLVRVRRVGEDDYREDHLAEVRFVPLVGEEAWAADDDGKGKPTATESPASLPERIAAAGESFTSLEEADLGPLLERIGDSRLVLLGEATHGTSEFYRMRARITKELIERKGFEVVAVEADWPDAHRIDHYVRHRDVPAASWTAFTRFPTWMWRNREVLDFVTWLHERNTSVDDEAERVAFHGLDLYSLHTSIHAVLEYLDEVDPETAATARERYGCLTPWQTDPITYGRAVLTRGYGSCEDDVVEMLRELLGKRMELVREQDGERFFDAVQNARVVADAERYYRLMYYGNVSSWNLRDQHMFDTLRAVLEHRGPDSKAVVWAHNSHLGDASFTEMASRGEHNLGQLCRKEFGDGAYLVGFGTDHGTVACASHWHDPMEVKEVRPAHEESYERLCHEAGVEGFLLPLRTCPDAELRKALQAALLERAIGVIYRPETELSSHYFRAILPDQFDEWIWFDETRAVRPLETHEVEGMPETFPFGL